MACKSLPTSFFPFTMDSWAIAYESNVRIRRSKEYGPYYALLRTTAAPLPEPDAVCRLGRVGRHLGRTTRHGLPNPGRPAPRGHRGAREPRHRPTAVDPEILPHGQRHLRQAGELLGFATPFATPRRGLTCQPIAREKAMDEPVRWVTKAEAA